MITNINEFRKVFGLNMTNEALSDDRKTKMKLDLLMQTAKEMIEAYDKAEAFEIAKKAKNEEIKGVLEKLGTHSIICKGVLIEMVGTYDNHSTNLTEYTKFVEDSVDVLGKQYKEMHDKIMAASTEMSKGTEYLRFNKNTKNQPNGTMEGIGDTIVSWFTSLKNWFTGFLPRANQEIDAIKKGIEYQKGSNPFNMKSGPSGKPMRFATTGKTVKFGESVVNENTFKSKYKQMIFDNLSKQSYNYLDLAKACGIQPSDTSENYGLYRNIQLLLDENIITRVKNGKVFVYSLAVPVATIEPAKKVDVTVDVPVDNVLITEALAKASALIEDAENEKYFLELAKIKEQQVIAMLNEFKSKKLAIDDKVLSLIKIESKPTLDKAAFMDSMTNADIVTESVADMAQNLFSLYTKSFQTSGSVRQYKDDSGLPEGTLGASFDWIIKQVVAPVSTVTKENKIVDFVRNSIAKLKRYVSSFRIASKRADMALNEI